MLIPVILSGGSGTRLWPVSRKSCPKPFVSLADGESLAQKTLSRALAVSDTGEVLTITNRDYYFLTRDEYKKVEQADPDKLLYLLEPEGRNTAPAITLAALALKERFGDDAVMLVLPADHLIKDVEGFEKSVLLAEDLAEEGHLVTFGMEPLEPETGYGYIRAGESLQGDEGYAVSAFVEKPDLETATEYMESGNYYWNSGMFCFRVSDFLAEMKEHAADVLSASERVFRESEREQVPLEMDAECFADLPDISIDYALMEKSSRCAVVKADFDWNDIGSWRSLSELTQSDEHGNRIRGKAVMVDSRNCYVQTDENYLVAAVGVNDLVIVETGDAILVAHRDQSQGVKEVVDQLKDWEHAAAIHHKTTIRPWGSFTVLQDAENYKVKRLVVKPGEVLSLQMHHHRSEHWTVVSGVAQVIVGEHEQTLNANESTYVPVKTRHRLSNPSQDDLVLIEVQCGDYLGEDDIVRFEDVYGRSGKSRSA